MDTDAGDLRDIFALLYDGDDWSFESDTEQDSHQDESRAEQPDAINGASRGADIPVEEGVTIAREGTVEKVEEAVSYMAGNRERYTRVRQMTAFTRSGAAYMPLTSSYSAPQKC